MESGSRSTPGAADNMLAVRLTGTVLNQTMVRCVEPGVARERAAASVLKSISNAPAA